MNACLDITGSIVYLEQFQSYKQRRSDAPEKE